MLAAQTACRPRPEPEGGGDQAVVCVQLARPMAHVRASSACGWGGGEWLEALSGKHVWRHAALAPSWAGLLSPA